MSTKGYKYLRAPININQHRRELAHAPELAPHAEVVLEVVEVDRPERRHFFLKKKASSGAWNGALDRDAKPWTVERIFIDT